MSEPLIVVDVQHGFLNEFTKHIPERVVELVRGGNYGPLIFTRFVNTPSSPYRRFLDWHSMENGPETHLAPEMEDLAKEPAKDSRVFVKEGLTGLTVEATEYLQAEKFERVTIVGIDTDMCVLKTAMDIFDLGIEPIVLIDCCASTAGLQAHLAGLAILSRNIGPHQLRDTGQGGGLFAAPDESKTAG